jgi:hypothetical protein
MTESGTTTGIASEPSLPDGAIPTQPMQVAQALTPAPGEITLMLTLTLSELGIIAASIQTCVRAGAIRAPDLLNCANSVLRKFHDAKLAYVKEHP